jgi:cation diffusion facilitator CzcD-associated flavoprotein CzcO
MPSTDVIVIGAGPAGLATALALKDAGVAAVVVDRADAVGASWRGRYDRLRLNTPRRMSHLPGRPYAKGTPTFPSRDQVVAHLDEHAAGLDLRLGVSVTGIERGGDGWLVHTGGQTLAAAQVVVATGFEHSPVIPDWPGRDGYAGELVHSAAYRNPTAYAGRAVLVVGPGCSGMEIAYDLAVGGAAKVWLSARTAPNIFMRTGPGGLPGDYIARALFKLPVGLADRIAAVGRKKAIGDLTEYGLPMPDEGVVARFNRTHQAPAIVDQEVIDAIKDGSIEIVAGVDALAPRAARLADGTTLAADAIVCATGYRRALDGLVGDLDVLDDTGLPRARGAQAALPGLRFVGYQPGPGMIGYTAREARKAASAIAREQATGRTGRRTVAAAAASA